MHEFLKKLDDIHGQIATDLGFPGWTYRDLPFMTTQIMDKLIELVGRDEIYFITHMRDTNDYVRGQVLFSPLAIERMKAHSVSKEGNDVH